jgi:hypothetical protein
MYIGLIWRGRMNTTKNVHVIKWVGDLLTVTFL